MFRAQFVLGGCSTKRGKDLPELALGHMLEALAAWDRDLLEHERARGKPLPSIYDAHKAGRLKYAREREWVFIRPGVMRAIGREDWIDAVEALRVGKADCEDLACWRAAELRCSGMAARVVFSVKRRPKGRLFHILVERADGQLEDPSRALGMRP